MNMPESGFRGYCRNCGNLLDYPSQFCLFCNTRNAEFCVVYIDEGKGCDALNRDAVKLVFISCSGDVELYSYSLYPEHESIRNTFEMIAERVHWRRIDDVLTSGCDRFRAELCSELFSKYAISDLSVTPLPPQSLDEIIEKLLKSLKVGKSLRKVNLKPEEKIGGAHSTIIGGREGRKLLHEIAKCEYVKKIVPGVIEGRGASSGGGVRLKLTRSDGRGNIRGILIDGTSVQKVLVITTASDEEEGEHVRAILREMLDAS